MAGPGRGGGWVVAQFALIGLVMVAILVPPGWPAGGRAALSTAGALLAITGAGLAVWAARVLGRALTPFPQPAAAGTLVESGPFHRVRHPIYAGGLLFFLGWSLYAGPAALGLTAALGVLWGLKARVEEAHLTARYPGYADYASRVRWRLVPGAY